MGVNLFELQVPTERQHPIFKMLLQDRYAPERAVLQQWAEGFDDRDNKFVQEFQMSFESSFWELYLHAALKEWQLPVDMRYHAPDFVVGGAHPFGLEATIAAPPAGGKAAYGYFIDDMPDNLNQFNIQATLRFCNSFDSKVKRYRKYYKDLEHMTGMPFVIGIASFDQPMAHFSAGRPAIAALYGLYHDEEATPHTASNVVSYNVSAAPKNENVNIELGLFCDDKYAEVSAVIYSSVAVWGKVRALAENPEAMTIYTTLHPVEGQLTPNISRRWKRDYVEHLMDGLYVFHNPFALHPLPKSLFAHPRIAQMIPAPDGELLTDAPDDFLLVRMLESWL